MSDAVKKVLIFAAGPSDQAGLRLGAEARDIESLLDQSGRFSVDVSLAARVEDLHRQLLKKRPEYVHFSGHGTGPDGLVFENNDGKTKLVGTDAIAELFRIFGDPARPDRVRLVVLNACLSMEQAEAIARHVPHVVGMRREIGDKAAVDFARGFYGALAADEPVERAFELGRNRVHLEGDGSKRNRNTEPDGEVPPPRLEQHLIPVLLGASPPVGAAVRKAARKLAELMADPGVNALVAGYKGRFDPELARTKRLRMLKDVHDLLHKVQMQVYRMVLLARDSFPKKRSIQALNTCQETLDDLVLKLRDKTGDKVQFPPPLPWIGQLAKAAEALAAAARPAPDARARLDDALDTLQRVVNVTPDRYNTQLVTVAQELKLSELVGGMRSIVGALAARDLDAGDLALVRWGAEELDGMDGRLAGLLRRHNLLQGVDNQIRTTRDQITPPEDDDPPPDYQERDLRVLRREWGPVTELTHELFADPVPADLAKMRDAAAKVTVAVAAGNHHDAVEGFAAFYCLAELVFFDTDISLLVLCNGLGRVGEQLFLMLRTDPS